MEIYIQAASTISPQKNSGQEPDYSSLIDPKSIRRMSRIIRMGVGAAAACLRDAGVACPDAIVTGTAYGCLADTGIFLSKMIAQQEEMLPPTAFIQSTHNTVGGQIALVFQCHGYNNTFVHRGFSFESALLDAMLLLGEEEPSNVLVGAVEEITEFSHAILSRFGLYRNTRAGEGAAFFLLTNHPAGALARLEGLETFYKPKDAAEIEDRVRSFLNSRSVAVNDLDLVILGNNGDHAPDRIYEKLSSSLFSGCAVIRYKNICGEYPTSTSFALWLATDIVKMGAVPATIRCEGKKKDEVRKILIYNHYQGIYHSLMLVSNYIKTILFFGLLTLHFSSFAQLDKQAASAFIERIVPTRADRFVIKEIPSENGKDVFELQSAAGKIILSGNKGLSIASALGYYLKHYCRADFGWNGNNRRLPVRLPVLSKKIHKITPYVCRYYFNYCTFNYSMSWWDWDRWQKEIDWMALNGINMPLALTGEEAIWRDVYRSMGFTDKELESFFCGPAYFAWLWMGNIDGWGGPLPQHWMDTHAALQKEILDRERSFGMTAVLPAFTGHVPPSFKDKFPNAKLKKTNWGSGFNDVYLLDPDDPLFVEIGKKYIEAQTKEFGTDHLYSSDTFNENTPPTNDSTFLSGVSKKIFQSMAAADPKAVWVMQGWLFFNNSSFWQPQQIKTLLNAVPGDQIIVLDLFTDTHPIWNRTRAFYGKPWIWNMLQNFGGNLALSGPMRQVAADPSVALHDAGSGNMVGIGITSEAIEQNPVVYGLMLENVWQDTPIDAEAWLRDYAERRYGKSSFQINEAWKILLNTAYNGSIGPASAIVERPTIDTTGYWTVNTHLTYDPRQLVKAWQLLMQSAQGLKESDGFQYDLVDLTRQVLANYANRLQPEILNAYRQKNVEDFKKRSAAFLHLMDDMDELLATRRDFLLGRWIDGARSNGATQQEKDLYEFNARDLITLWGDKASPLHEYSNRQWAGLIKGFYKPRWEMFFEDISRSLAENNAFDNKAFENQVKEWEWAWVNKHDKYPDQAMGNPVAVAEKLYEKYKGNIGEIYR